MPEEVENCSRYLDREWGLLRRKRVILALGRIAWDAAIALARRQGMEVRRAEFGHGVVCRLNARLALVGSYHVSQQNTFTGKLTPRMFDEVLQRCKAMGRSRDSYAPSGAL